MQHAANEVWTMVIQAFTCKPGRQMLSVQRVQSVLSMVLVVWCHTCFFGQNCGDRTAYGTCVQLPQLDLLHLHLSLSATLLDLPSLVRCLQINCFPCQHLLSSFSSYLPAGQKCGAGLSLLTELFYLVIVVDLHPAHHTVTIRMSSYAI